MFLGNPVFPISFQIEQVAETVETTIKKKNWKSFDRGEIKLVLTPFYIFYYDAVFEEEGKTTKKSERGRLALNGETAELRKELAKSLPQENELVKELPDQYPLVVRKPLFTKNEAEKIALLKTASLVGTNRDNIVLTGFQVIYYPMWIAFVTVAKQTYQLEISAITGEIFGEEKVPEREKGFVEITKETLSDLKRPGAWIEYSKGIADFAGDKMERNNSGRVRHVRKTGPSNMPEIMQRPFFWISIILLVILIALTMYL